MLDSVEFKDPICYGFGLLRAELSSKREMSGNGDCVFYTVAPCTDVFLRLRGNLVLIQAFSYPLVLSRECSRGALRASKHLTHAHQFLWLFPPFPVNSGFTYSED